MKPFARAIALLPLLAMTHIARADPVQYRVDVIGRFWDFQPTDINNRGQVVGFGAYEFTEGDITYGNQRAFLWDAGTVKYFQDNSTQIYGSAVNDAGVVVGNTYGWTSQAAVLGDGGPVPIYSGPDNSWATAINNSGQIAVYGGAHGYIYSPDGTRIDMGYLGSGSVQDLSNSGVAVGNFAVKGIGYHAFRYEGGALTDLGTLGGAESIAYAVNDSGVVVGDSSLATGYFHATMFGQNGPVDLGTFGGAYSTAYGVNSLGQVVGYAYTTQQQAHGFLYANGTMTDLNSYMDPSSGWTISQGVDINDRGQILAFASDANGGSWEVVLSPVPAPASYAMMMAGLALLAIAGKRRRNAAARYTFVAR